MNSKSKIIGQEIRIRVNKKNPPTKEERELAFTKLKENLAQLDIADALKLMRNAAGLDQTEYAKLTGVSKIMLAKIEAGSINPSVQILNKLGRPFGFCIGFVSRLADIDKQFIFFVSACREHLFYCLRRVHNRGKRIIRSS